jgi:DNA-binding LacI/PurR family transcriptional regulator
MDIITQPIADMGNSAGSRILERIADPNMSAGEIVLHADCVPRTGDLSA